MSKTSIGSINVYGGNVAAGNDGPTQQSTHIESMTLQQIHSLIDAVQAEPANTLTEACKKDVLTELNILADQAVKPRARRESPKIDLALEKIPKILSVAKNTVDLWNAIAPSIHNHFR